MIQVPGIPVYSRASNQVRTFDTDVSIDRRCDIPVADRCDPTHSAISIPVPLRRCKALKQLDLVPQFKVGTKPAVGVCVMRISVTIGIVSSAFVSLLCAANAYAQAPECVTGSPGSDDCEERKLPQVQTALVVPANLEVVKPERGHRVNDFFMPNGNLTKKGDFSLQIHGLGMYNVLSYGVTDKVELSVSAPVYPVFLALGARVQLAPTESPFRAVVSARGWFPLINDNNGFDDEPYSYWTQLSGTIAYETERFNLHASLSGAYHSVDGVQLPAANVGATVRIKHNLAAHVNYGSVNITGTSMCRSCINPRKNGLLFGLKHMGNYWDTDFGFLVVSDPDGEDDTFPIPMLSFQRNY